MKSAEALLVVIKYDAEPLMVAPPEAVTVILLVAALPAPSTTVKYCPCGETGSTTETAPGVVNWTFKTQSELEITVIGVVRHFLMATFCEVVP